MERNNIRIDGQEFRRYLNSRKVNWSELCRQHGYHESYLRICCTRGTINKDFYESILDMYGEIGSPPKAQFEEITLPAKSKVSLTIKYDKWNRPVLKITLGNSTESEDTYQDDTY